MSLHDDLMKQAKDLASREPKRPKQASLRRAISAAYYSLFHLLTYEASKIFAKDEKIIEMIARAYAHTEMKHVAEKFVKGTLPSKIAPLLKVIHADPARLKVFETIKRVAQTFVDLQQARHEADYNLGESFKRSEVTALISKAESATSAWRGIRDDDLARIFLGCFLLWQDWNKERS